MSKINTLHWKTQRPKLLRLIEKMASKKYGLSVVTPAQAELLPAVKDMVGQRWTQWNLAAYATEVLGFEVTHGNIIGMMHDEGYPAFGVKKIIAVAKPVAPPTAAPAIPAISPEMATALFAYLKEKDDAATAREDLLLTRVNQACQELCTVRNLLLAVAKEWKIVE